MDEALEKNVACIKSKENIAAKDLEVNVAGEASEEPELVTIDIEPIFVVSDDECESQQESKAALKKARKREWRAACPKNKVCDQCPKAFKTNAELTRHKRSHTGERPFICTQCGNSYTQLAHLQEHTVKHHSANRSKDFKCEECSSTFYRKCELERHFKTHTGEKPYKCEICSKRFTQKNNLIMHVKVHADDRPHECLDCGKRFITLSKMKRHMQKHDKKKNKDMLSMVEVVDDNSCGED